jgi:PIN domain nuclease of toxin-antitoxin system
VESALVLDAQPVVAFLAGEPSGGEVAALLREKTKMSVANAAEVVDVLVRVLGIASEDAKTIVFGFLEEVSAPVDVTREIALSAGAIRGEAYRRGRLDVSLADCIAIATATPGGRVATSDPPLARVALAEGVGVVALPDSRGRRPRA